MSRSAHRKDGAAPAAGVTVTMTVDDLEQIKNRLGCFASLSHPDLSRLRVRTAADGTVEWVAPTPTGSAA